MLQIGNQIILALD
ncbi:hypothetical protein VCHENC02_4241A, partial [Vibrio harveyi]